MDRRKLITGGAALAAYGALGRVKSEAAALPVPFPTFPQSAIVGGNFRRRICIVGDSYAGGNANNFANGVFANPTNNVPFNEVGWLNALAGNPFDFGFPDVYAQSGGTLVNVLSFLPQIIAQPYGFCIVQGCHNDFLGGMSMATVAANYRKIVAILLAAGITPIIVLGCPINSNEGSTYVTLDQVRKLNLEANVWKRRFCAQLGIPYWNWATPMSDTSSTGAGYGPNMTDDGIHPNGVASFYAAQQGLVDLAGIIPSTRRHWLVSTPEDVYDATSNPFGNMAPNAGLFWAGTAVGTPNLTNGQGTIPSGWNFGNVFQVPSGGTVTASLQPSTDGLGQWLQIQMANVTGTPGTYPAYLLYQFLNMSGLYAIGDQVEAGIEFQVASGTILNSLTLLCVEQNADGTQVVNASGGSVSTTYNMPAGPFSGVLRTNPITVPAQSPTGSSGRILFPQVKFQFPVTSTPYSGTISFRRFTVRKVPTF